MKDKLISIIVPIYNSEKYLEKCIDSILNQTYKLIEVILINDGSTDNSLNICNFYAKRDKRVIVVQQENSGVSKSRQKGIDISNGEYVAFIDSDDFIDSNYILKLYRNMQKSNSDIICCNSIDIEFDNYKNNKILVEEVVINKERLMIDYFNGSRYAYCIWGKLYKKGILSLVKFRDMKYAEDTCMIIELFNKCNKVHLLNYDGYYYRGQEDSITNTINSIEKSSDLLTRSEIIYYICKENFPLLIDRAQKQFVNSLYGAVVSYSVGNKYYYNKFLSKFNSCYKELNKKYLCISLKGILLIMFKINSTLCEKFIKIYYCYKESKVKLS